jgi:FkbM family methyltransferase
MPIMSFAHSALKSTNRLAKFLFAFHRRMPTYFRGQWFWLNKECWSSLYLRYEPNIAKAIESNLHPGNTFWDVGANVGIFSLFAASLVGPRGNVVSFEPSPHAFDLLCSNIEGNKTIRALQFGVGNEDNTAMMSVQGASTGNSFVKEVVELSQHFHSGVPISQTRVPIHRLDTLLTLLDQIPAPTLVKIDIEGFEVEALSGADRLLATKRPILIIEIHPLQLTLSGSHEEKLFTMLRRHQYDCEIIDRDARYALYSIIARPSATSIAA